VQISFFVFRQCPLSSEQLLPSSLSACFIAVLLTPVSPAFLFLFSYFLAVSSGDSVFSLGF
jgi:hypothetical protein